MKSLFHLAFNVTDLDEARRFYGGVLGCTEGRSTATWVDFDFCGHRSSLHLGQPFQTECTGHVGSIRSHAAFRPGAAPDWQALRACRPRRFILAPQVRFEGQPGEQWTMFFCDPFGNPVEIRACGRWTRSTRADRRGLGASAGFPN